MKYTIWVAIGVFIFVVVMLVYQNVRLHNRLRQLKRERHQLSVQLIAMKQSLTRAQARYSHDLYMKDIRIDDLSAQIALCERSMVQLNRKYQLLSTGKTWGENT